MADPAPDRDPRPNRMRRTLLIVGAIVLAFVVGFGWQWFAARGYRAERDEALRELAHARLATTLATAVIQADRGRYDGARDLASDFFTGLQASVASSGAAASPELRDILASRDAVITTLSRAEANSEEILTRMYVRYAVATGAPGVEVPVPAAVPEPGAPAPPGGNVGGSVPPS